MSRAQARKSLPIGITGHIVEADYQPSPISDYAGNPLIEALPSIEDTATVIRELTAYPPSPSVRQLPDYLRQHGAYTVLRMFQPLTAHTALASDIAVTVRQGYISRNPLTPEAIQRINHPPKWSELPKIAHTTAINGFSFIGVSGMGKTTAVNRILTTQLPQIVTHPGTYQGRNIAGDQVVWMKLDCPFNGSVKGLCLQFFTTLDALLHQDPDQGYRKLYTSGRDKTANELIPDMSQLGLVHHLGLLVIDEIQHLSGAGSEEMLNFFVNLSNLFRIPIILVGTPKALSLLSRELQQSRRGIGIVGDTWWAPLPEASEDWQTFLGKLVDYNFVSPNNKTLSPAFRHALWHHSCGILDFAVKLFILAQLRALVAGHETLQAVHIRSVARDHVHLPTHLLDRLRSGDAKSLMHMADIETINLLQALQQDTAAGGSKSAARMRRQSVLRWLDEVNVPAHVATRAYQRAVKALGAHADLGQIRGKAYTEAQSLIASEEPATEPSDLPVNQGDTSLPAASQVVQDAGTAAHAVLQDQKMIANLDALVDTSASHSPQSGK